LCYRELFLLGLTLFIKPSLQERRMDKIRIFLVDAHPLFRYGLLSVLNQQPEFQVIGDSSRCRDAIPVIEQLKPDVVIMDIFLPECDGLKTTAYIKQKLPETEVIILTVSGSEELFLQAMQAGAKGYLLKGAGITEIIETVKMVARGNMMVSPLMAGKLMERLREKEPGKMEKGLPKLSSREKEILKLTAKGSSNREIASILLISNTTVKAHMRNILEKLQVKNRTQAVSLAIARGIISHEN